MEEVSKPCPAIAVPMTVKMPEPMTAPIPSAVSDSGPRVFFRLCAGSSESRISLSIDLVAKICFDRTLAPEKDWNLWIVHLPGRDNLRPGNSRLNVSTLRAPAS